MAIEIKELIIRTHVDYASPDESSAADEALTGDQSELVRRCVKQVLKILKQEQKR